MGAAAVKPVQQHRLLISWSLETSPLLPAGNVGGFDMIWVGAGGFDIILG